MSGVEEALALVSSRLAAPFLGYVVSLSYRGWFGVVLFSAIGYAYRISTLARTGRDSPCVPFGRIFRIAYGLFQTDIAHYVLGLAQTREGQEQKEENRFDTNITTLGQPEMRIQLVPILGNMFGGNYSFLIWDEHDPQRRAIVVDPADPHPVLQAAKKENLQVELLLTTHWHFDHSGGNRAFKRALPKLEVIASAAERGRTPAVTRRLLDLEEVQCGRLTVRAHAVPGHTIGSMVYEIFSRATPHQPSAAFTGDTLFCGGCGALFECSATTLHNSLGMLTQRLKKETLLFPGHEYSEMLLTQALRRDPNNEAARGKLAQVRDRRKQKQPSLPSSLEEEMEYNPYLRSTAPQLAMLCGAVTL